MQSAPCGLNYYYFISFQGLCAQNFSILQPLHGIVFGTFVFVSRPTNHNNKTIFIEILEPKMQPKNKLHYLTIVISSNL
jgi:hypothetical protein